MAGVLAQHATVQRELLHERGGNLSQVGAAARAGHVLVAGACQQRVRRVPPLVEQCLDCHRRQKGETVVGRHRRKAAVQHDNWALVRGAVAGAVTRSDQLLAGTDRVVAVLYQRSLIASKRAGRTSYRHGLVGPREHIAIDGAELSQHAVPHRHLEHVWVPQLAGDGLFDGEIDAELRLEECVDAFHAVAEGEVRGVALIGEGGC